MGKIPPACTSRESYWRRRINKGLANSWIMPDQDLVPFGPQLLQDQDLMISDLLARETKEWNAALVNRLLPELSEHIISIRPSILGSRDTYIWTQQNSGIYTAKSSYYSSLQDSVQSTPQLLNDRTWNWQKLIWSPPLLPKIKMFLWKCAQNALSTGANLQKRGLLNNTVCIRCGAIETLKHIFFDCTFATEVWNLCPWCLLSDWSDIDSFQAALQASVTKINLPPT